MGMRHGPKTPICFKAGSLKDVKFANQRFSKVSIPGRGHGGEGGVAFPSKPDTRETRINTVSLLFSTVFHELVPFVLSHSHQSVSEPSPRLMCLSGSGTSDYPVEESKNSFFQLKKSQGRTSDAE